MRMETPMKVTIETTRKMEKASTSVRARKRSMKARGFWTSKMALSLKRRRRKESSCRASSSMANVMALSS
jgi:hypothetical protein